LFALGDYDRAATVLNALLAVAPGMNWATMSSLYPSVETYTEQLRALEKHTKQNPKDAAARFVLAYHYLVAGHADSAIGELEAVVAVQPGDQIATRMLEALRPEPADEPPPPVPPTSEATEQASADEASGNTTDLVGKWLAKRNDDLFELLITEDWQFAWRAVQAGQEAIQIEGDVATTSDTLVLESPDQGSMVATVKSLGPDQFQFFIVGSPPNDEGLTFDRVME
jgi:tetratricopeptide (TPR) repeat protein